MNTLAVRKSISEGLSSWLTFEHHCGRNKLFCERYLAYPIGQLLSKHTTGLVIGEHNHPSFPKPARGRPLQLDFIIQEGTLTKLVVETKWAGSNVSVETVLWDCVRLELAAHHFSCDAMFILAGTRKMVDEILDSPALTPPTKKGKPSRILGINGSGRNSVNIHSPITAYGSPLHKKLKEYPSMRYATSFVCEQGTRVPNDPKASDYTAVVWNIRPEIKKRALFKP